MKRIQCTLATAIAFSGSTVSAVAAGPLAPIDTEQRAASALVTVLDAASRAQGIVAVITADSTVFAQEVFKNLNAATITAPALRNMPDGATRPCVNGGSFDVRMPRTLPRVLHIEWTNCQVLRWDPASIATGPGQITLFSDSFRPEQVAAIRLGNSTRDLAIAMTHSDSESISHTVRTRNVRMTGWIPMFGPGFEEDSYIAYAYETSGFVRDVSDTDYSDPARADFHYETYDSAESTAVTGVTANLQQGFYYDDDQRLLWGQLTSTAVEPYWGTLTFRLGVENFAVRRVYDYNGWTSSLSVNGTVDYRWPDAALAGCADGRFAVRTVAPIYSPDMNANVQDSGELRINGAATVRYYSAATVPPHLPAPTNGTLLNMTVRNVGTFNYDVGGFPDPLRTAANCQR